MYRYGYCIGRRVNSPAILADAFENRADAISSVACVVGIAGAVFIHPILDPIAAIVVGLIILKNSAEQLKEAVGGLMDRSIPGPDESLIRSIALSHEGVTKVAYVRTRQVGGAYWADVGVCTAPDATVHRADAIVSGLQEILMRNPNIKHVAVFILPAEGKGLVIGPSATEQPA
jgi:cation diffusion facilitator family transporter